MWLVDVVTLMLLSMLWHVLFNHSDFVKTVIKGYGVQSTVGISLSKQLCALRSFVRELHLAQTACELHIF
jgi:hypothetical protein